MSTDLQFRQEVLGIRCPAMTIQVNLSSPVAASSPEVANHGSCTGGVTQSKESTIGGGKASEAYCRTPESPRHMIPKAQNCPPAPKKPTPARVPSCKRKLNEFFEIVAREEIQSFFRQIEVKPNPSSPGTVIKKRCLV